MCRARIEAVPRPINFQDFYSKESQLQSIVQVRYDSLKPCLEEGSDSLISGKRENGTVMIETLLHFALTCLIPYVPNSHFISDVTFQALEYV